MKISKHKSRTVVGLDIEAGSVAATEITSNGSIELGNTGIVQLAPGVTREGEVADAEALTAALTDLFAESKLSSNVRIGIANQRVVVRTLRLPLIEGRDEIETAIRFQAPDQIPMPLEEAVLDWQVLEPSPETQLARQMDVVVVAARREGVAALTRACRNAGLNPVGIDVSAFGMIRALAGGLPAPGQADLDPGAPTASYEDRVGDDSSAEAPAAVTPARLYCNLGDSSNLAVASGSRCLFTRLSSFGMEGIAQNLAQRRELTLEHARLWMAHVGLERPLEELDGDPEIAESCRDALIEGAGKLAGELRLSLDYYGSQEAAVPVEEIVVCGHGSAIDGLPRYLEQELGLALRVGRPPALAELDDAVAARLTLAYGLALEE